MARNTQREHRDPFPLNQHHTHHTMPTTPAPTNETDAQHTERVIQSHDASAKAKPMTRALVRALKAASSHFASLPNITPEQLRVQLSNGRAANAVAHHRNGVCGVPFTVAIVKERDGKHTRRMLVIRFASGECCTAALDLDLAAKGEIRFGVNSFRGDHYADDMKKLGGAM